MQYLGQMMISNSKSENDSGPENDSERDSSHCLCGYVGGGCWSLRDHGSGHHQLVHQLAEVAADGLSVLQPDVHADRLLLQGLDLAADGGQVALETAQHALHTLKEEGKKDVWFQFGIVLSSLLKQDVVVKLYFL